jgi:hypothetical protein
MAAGGLRTGSSARAGGRQSNGRHCGAKRKAAFDDKIHASLITTP